MYLSSYSVDVMHKKQFKFIASTILKMCHATKKKKTFSTESMYAYTESVYLKNIIIINNVRDLA